MMVMSRLVRLVLVHVKNEDGIFEEICQNGVHCLEILISFE